MFDSEAFRTTLTVRSTTHTTTLLPLSKLQRDIALEK